MPKTKVVYFRDDDGTVPVSEWLDTIEQRDRRIKAKCIVSIRLLSELGYQLHRPNADFLRDGIYELRIRLGSVNYRILYFFYDDKAILTHSLMKEADVPERHSACNFTTKQKCFESTVARRQRGGRMMQTSDVLEIMQHRYENDEQMQDMIAEEHIKSLAAMAIYEARTAAGMTQKQLAEKIGTQQPVIARLEDADYEGHTISMLQRIAAAFDKRVEIRFVDYGSACEENETAPVYEAEAA